MHIDYDIQPLHLKKALLYFGIPALGVALVVYLVMPAVAAVGIPILFNYLIVYATVPMLLLITAAIIAYRREGHPMSWRAFKIRFRLRRMKRVDWLWAIGLTLFMFLTAGLLSFTSRWLASFKYLVPPVYWPAELKPGPPAAQVPSEFMGYPLAGNWWIFALLLVSLAVATIGEELWWRGYILPRQELAHGQGTWFVHGVLWCLFHLFAPWNVLSILPGCLALSFVAQRLKNTWPAIIAHGLANGLLVLIVVVAGILGA